VKTVLVAVVVYAVAAIVAARPLTEE